MADKEDLSLKLLQLQCIIDSKDRELQILRQQASQDPEEIFEQLKHENEALKKQLTSSPSASTTAVNGCAALPHAVQGAASEAVAGLQKSSAALQQLLDMLAGHSHGSAGTKRATANGIVGKHDELVQLNVSGTYMEVPRSVLLQFPASRLTDMFTADATSEAPLRDHQGRYYLPYEAPAFSKIISALQARHVFGPTSSCATIQIPRHDESHADARFWAYVKDLVNNLGLQQIISQPHALPDQHAESAAAAAYGAGNAAAAAAAQKRSRRNSSGGGDRKSHGGSSSSSSNHRAAGANKAAAAAPDGANSKAAAASAAAAAALLDSPAVAEKTTAQAAAEAQSAVLQALQPLQQLTGGSENPSPNRRDRHSRGGHHSSTEKSHKSSSSSGGGAGPAAAAGEGGNAAAAAAPMANGGVSNAMAAAALKGLMQQKRP